MKRNLQFTRKNVASIIGLILSLIILALAIIGVKAYKTQEKPIAKVEREEIKAGTPVTTVPYGYTRIDTATDLANIENDLSGKYILMADIDLSGTTYDKSVVAPYNSTRFRGEFDGNYHKISNLNIQSGQDGGLFGYTDSATIKNVSLVNVNIKETSSSHTMGAIVGEDIYRSTIEGITVTGNISVETTRHSC